MNIEALEAVLAKGDDSAMLRFGLGKACLDAGRLDDAATHLQRAVELQRDYSAAWKLLGKTLTQLQRNEAAIATYTSGIAIAEAKGDIQAAKEMQVFLKRLQRLAGE